MSGVAIAIGCAFLWTAGFLAATGWHRPELLRRCALTLIALNVFVSVLIEVTR